MIKNRTRSNCE